MISFIAPAKAAGVVRRLFACPSLILRLPDDTV
jgi:hypothetical protein